jgi:ribosome maturation factor RimP
MQYSNGNETDANREMFDALVKSMGIELIELDIFHSKGRKGSLPGLQVRIIIYKPGSIGTDDCTKVHRAIIPVLEAAYPGHEFSVEVSTPGINRLIKDGVELGHYRGRGLRVWRTDISAWSYGILDAVDEQGITIKSREGTVRLDYSIIAKARLDYSQEGYVGN